MKATLIIVLLSLLAISFFARASHVELDASSYVDAELVEDLNEEEHPGYALLEESNFMVPGSKSSHDSITEEEFIALIEAGRAYAKANPVVLPGSPLATAQAKGASIKIGSTVFRPVGAKKPLPPIQAPLLPPDQHFSPERVNMTYKLVRQLAPGQKLVTGSFKTEFQFFKQNYKYAYQLNTRYGNKYNREPFKSTGTYGGWSPDVFKKKIRNTKNPKGIKSKNGVYKRTALTAAQKKLKLPPVKGGAKSGAQKPTAASSSAQKTSKSVKLPKATTPKKPKSAKKGGQALVELEQTPVKTGGGGRVGGAGGSSQKSGKTGGASGGDVQKSGKTGGADGSTVDKSGKTGGAGDAGAAGAAGGAPFKPLTSQDIENSMMAAGVNANDYLMATGVLAEWPTYDHGVLDQGACGSCWAQTAANNIYYLHYKYFPLERVAKPSVQQILDCVQTDLSHGCDGGTPMDALTYMMQKNFDDVEHYPLLDSGGVGTCRPSPAPISDSYRSWGWSNAVPACTVENCPRQQFQEMELLRIVHEDNLFPIVYVDSSNFQLYSSGIFPTNLCSSSLSAGDHVMEIISYYTDEHTDVPYWILRNSWGENWGEKGFMKLPFGVNACGLANFAILATPKPNAQQITYSQASDPTAARNQVDPHSRAAIEALG